MGNVLYSRFRDSNFNGQLTLISAGSFFLMNWNLIGTSSNGYFKLFNSATVAAVSLGNTVPVVTLFIPALGTSFFSNEGDAQNQFANGIVIAVTSALTDSSSAVLSGCYIDFQYDPA